MESDVKGGRMVETHNMGWQRNGKEGGKGEISSNNQQTIYEKTCTSMQ